MLASKDGIERRRVDGKAVIRTQSGACSSYRPYLISVLYAGNQFIATGNYVGINPSTGFLLTSPDGKTWTLQSTGSNLYGIAYGVVGGVGTYVAVGGQ